jgi:sugar lactone lactonase YvrE
VAIGRLTRSLTSAWALLFLAVGASAQARDTSPFGYVFVSSYTGSSNGVILIYKAGVQHPSPVAKFTVGVTSPTRLWVDKNGTLYVPNYYQNNVQEYAGSSKTPTFTLTTNVDGPGAVAVDNNLTVYVANTAGAYISEYPAGSGTPNLFIINSIGILNALAIDHAGNLYVCQGINQSPWQFEVREFAPGATTGTQIILGSNACGGLAFDSTGNLYVSEFTPSGRGPGNEIAVFAPGQGTPFRTITNSIAYSPGQIVMSPRGYLNVLVGGHTNAVEIYAPGGNTSINYILTKPAPNGIALKPAAPL